jgi:archaemetzincin
MKPVRLVPVGTVSRKLLDAARHALVFEMGADCRESAVPLDPSFAFHEERGQYDSTAIVEKLAEIPGENGEVVAGVTTVDLFMPILTFVFGEAQLGGRAAVVSSHRLHQSFYGLEEDDALTQERLAKEVIHEAGHVLALTHCDDYQCVMAASHSVEWLDVKSTAFCRTCRKLLDG